MKIAFITRSTLYKVPGGDTIQVTELAKHLRNNGTAADILLTDQKIDYPHYDLFYFTNIIRPSDILYHIPKIKKPFIVSPILIDYNEFDCQHREGISGLIFRRLRRSSIEYIKTISRWLKGNDRIQSKKYIWRGQNKSIREILSKATAVLPGTESEYKKLLHLFGIEKNYTVVPNGVDTTIFRTEENTIKNNRLVVCAARIEGLKNQLNLIKALNNTPYTLLIIGSPAPNQGQYYAKCRKIAAKNIVFHNRLPQEILKGYYKEAKVHALPSWFETCGLSSLEAAAMGCNIVITDKGYTSDYFGNDAFYCNPASPESIFKAIDIAAKSNSSKQLQEKINANYTWQKAASTIQEICKNIISE
ncbi:MAG: glycosyltransferase family 4 protein [Bacteroidetes bacterium]|nr:glycosyltransferase family 4 protein [Bacteroidota bacterium]